MSIAMDSVFCYNAKKLMEENRLKFGYKHCHRKKIEGV